MNECPELEERTWRKEGAGAGLPKWDGPGQGPWGCGMDRARQSLRKCPFWGHWGQGGRQDRDCVLEDEQGLWGQRHQWETDRRTDSRMTQKTWGPQNEIPRTDSQQVRP